MIGIIIGIFIVSIILVLIISHIKIVRQTDNVIVERLGAYHATWSVGVHFLVPFIDRIAKVVSLKEQVKDFDPQSVITKDNVTMQIDTIVFYKITDAQKYCYGVENPVSAIENLTTTTLRNIVGDLDLDGTLMSRDTINAKMCEILDKATDPWGVKIFRVELKNIMPPKDIREAMEKQMRAEREKREMILRAEGDKQAKILIATGEKESAILKAEGEKQKKILEAEANAKSIEVNKQAEALGIKLIKEANADDKVLRLRAFEAFIKACDGQATKVLIPTDFKDMTRLLTTVESIKATVEDKKTNRPWDKTIDKTDEKKSDKTEKTKMTMSTGDKR